MNFGIAILDISLLFSCGSYATTKLLLSDELEIALAVCRQQSEVICYALLSGPLIYPKTLVKAERPPASAAWYFSFNLESKQQRFLIPPTLVAWYFSFNLESKTAEILRYHRL